MEMIFLALAQLVVIVPVFVRAAGIGNPYQGATVALNPSYVEKVRAAVQSVSDPLLASQASLVERFPTFFWIDRTSVVSDFGDFLSQVNAVGGTQIAQAVIYNLPDRDCSALASAGELTIADGGAEKYAAYIDSIVEQVDRFPSVRVVFVVEPDSLANLITNLNVPKCANAASTYRDSISYAISQLQQDNVWLYIDVAHSGWLGWPDNLQPTADLFASVLQGAGGNATVRGLATDVSNYYSLRGPQDPIQEFNPNYNEELYINALTPFLQQRGFPSQFIVDQGRSGVSGIRSAGDDWCNVLGAGIGLRPSTNTGNQLIDSIVWVKPPGESDGTSDSSSPRFDQHCARSTAAQGAPEAGEWFQSYFEDLVRNANPPLSGSSLVT